MANSSLPFDIDAIEKLIRDGTRLLEVTRPVWREVSRVVGRVPPRKYLPVAAGVAAVALLGVVVVSIALRKPRVVPPAGAEPEDVEVLMP